MKALFEKIPLYPGESFACREYHASHFEIPWHFHAECELALFVRGRGMRYIGDSIEHFEDGDLVLIGSNLPHFWWKDASDHYPSHAVVVQFDAGFGGHRLFDLPEGGSVRRMLQKARRGMLLTGGLRDEVAEGMCRMRSLRDWEKLCLLLELLGLIARARPSRLLASPGFSPELDEQDAHRLDAVCRYVSTSFAERISQPRAASLAGYSTAAFSRFFHKRMGRTFEAHVAEVRVGYACRRLIEDDATIAEIAYASGFGTLSNFNRRFLALKGVTPREYRRQHLRV